MPNESLKSYLNLKLTKLDIFSLLVAFGGTLLMNLSPVQKSSSAMPIAFLMAGICYLRPISGFYFIAFAQTMPELIGGSFNPAQIGAIAWLVVALPRLLWLRFSGLGYLWVFLPSLAWGSIVTQHFPISFSLPLGNLEKALIYTIIACQLANAARGEYLKCLLGLSLGALSVSFSFWFNAAGLPVDLSTWGDARGGFHRMGGAGTDAVMLWVGTLMGLGGVLGTNMTLNTVTPKDPWASHMSKLSLLVLVLAGPPIIATMTLAAYLGFAIMVGTYIFLMFKAGKMGMLIKPILIASLALGLMLSTNLFRSRDRLMGMSGWYGKYSERHHTTLGTRKAVWEISLRTIAENPLFGAHSNEAKEDIPDEYKRREFMFLSHNVFLDVGRGSGIPGMLLYSFFIFYPLVRMIKRLKFDLSLPFILFYLALMIFLNVLSVIFYKTIWAFWMLAAIVSGYSGSKPSVAEDLRASPSLSGGELNPLPLQRDVRSKEMTPFSRRGVGRATLKNMSR